MARRGKNKEINAAVAENAMSAIPVVPKAKIPKKQKKHQKRDASRIYPVTLPGLVAFYEVNKLLKTLQDNLFLEAKPVRKRSRHRKDRNDAAEKSRPQGRGKCPPRASDERMQHPSLH